MAHDLIPSIGSAPWSIERIVQFRVALGADLLEAIGQAVRQEEIESGVIISGVGALNKAIFRNLTVFPKRFPVQPEDRIYLEIDTPMELVSLGGWIAPISGGGTENPCPLLRINGKGRRTGHPGRTSDQGNIGRDQGGNSYCGAETRCDQHGAGPANQNQ